MKRLMAALVVGFSAMLAPLPAAAFDSGSGQGAAHLPADDAVRFAKQIEANLAAQGARVALVFRTGRAREDLPEGISYTHGAFWVYQTITLNDGRQVPGYAVYNLYHGNEDRLTSALVQDFPVDFTLGSAVDDVGIIVPTPEMQRRILMVMGSETYQALHQPAYSLLSNPFDLRFQNCTEFMLDVVAAAAWETADPRQIKANLAAHYQATPVQVGVVERLFAPMADERLRLDDQRGGRIITATYESMAAFMEAHRLAARVYSLERDPDFVFEP